ncbi:hypothetical protein FRC12_014802 [Ceratobasidium sp. 428]|nr:hypothetical protein FRC12_014802 [Ceratobasidium sp. 428]
MGTAPRRCFTGIRQSCMYRCTQKAIIRVSNSLSVVIGSAWSDWFGTDFTGTAKELGDGPGVGFNFNFPLPQHVTGDEEYIATLKQAITGISEFSPKWLIVSFGVDTYKDDPICNFRLTSGCYIDIGREIGGLGLPTLFAMEGGYHLDTLGINVGGVLSGYEHAKLK